MGVVRPRGPRVAMTLSFVWFILHPMFLSALRPLERLGISAPYAGDLDDFSPASFRAHSRVPRRHLAFLRWLFPAKTAKRFSYSDLVSLECYMWWLQAISAAVDLGCQIQLFPFAELVSVYPCHHMAAPPGGLFEFLASFHKIESPKDARYFIERVKKLPKVLQQLKETLDSSPLPPKFSLEIMCEQLKRVKVPSVDGSTQLSRLLISALPSMKISENQKQSLVKELVTSLDPVFSASEQLTNFIQENLLQKSGLGDGVWRLENPELYGHLLKCHIGDPTITPEEVHEVGFREIAILHKQLKSALQDAGVACEEGKAPPEALRQFFEKPEFHYQHDERDLALQDFEKFVARAVEALPKAFFALPPVSPVVRPTAFPGLPHQAKPASLDGAIPPTFNADVHNPEKLNKPTMPSIAFHEALPGHLLERTIAQRLPIPIFCKNVPFLLTAFLEGWALYAEQSLSVELGLYQTPIEHLGRIQNDLLRAARLVVDTGLHSKKWTREQAVSFLLENVGLSKELAQEEVDRYCVMPGQACAYKLGHLTILELRQEAKSKLGERFDIRIFHKALLSAGCLPLYLMKKNVRHLLGIAS
ncbi:DUF885 family protein [Pelomyxa schiedti]|nr:DUF885 family protein [Pelomyxa schiedti]